MTCQETEILIQKYLNGETTPDEERLLALEVSRDDAPQEWSIIAETLGELTIDEALFDQIMEERNRKPRIIKMWPWAAAACIAALLIVFLAPPREEVSPTEPQIAKVEPKEKIIEEKPTIQMQESEIKVAEKPLQATKRVGKASVPEEVKEEPQEAKTEAIPEPTSIENDLARTEDNVQNPPRGFDNLSTSLRARGEQIMRRVAMIERESGLPQQNNI